MESQYIMTTNMNIVQKENLRTNATDCICYRPHCNIICNGCGFWTKGRVRYMCPQHPKIVFLHDHAQCPRCRSYSFMLTEI
ncbi:uncharacterized protein LOC105274801 [Ooceraea biroi]|uniref:uncharacterized protein LOC105274801 n=1 Tax=Ooceraea biroi TaxID=2015173 RepID=UPI0005BA2DB5|nr:uncharacterized protein LOC105274801 [Ooceraea biroi]